MNAYTSDFIAAVSPLPDLGSVLDRTSFFGLIETAIRVAEPGSVPVLMLVELAWRDATTDSYGAERTARLLQTAPARIAAALGGNGFVCALRETRLAVLAASDCSTPVSVLADLILASLACPVLADDVVRTQDPVLAVAQWGVDGETPEELFVSADVALHAKLRSPSSPTQAAASTASQPERLADQGPVASGIRFRRSPLQ
jgi:predicted signal transduction protein with EAL and GGDEF domain